MANVFVEPTGDGNYQIEFADGLPTIGPFSPSKEAIDRARQSGHHPLVARERELNERKKPERWRSAG